ncbi:hypothetical protein AOCH_002716 [Aspergillus ochraceoroseus]|uniref:RRM domain-containing protein n=1 Tax=Aspergillus ochraceoroseus TaxID=138278 RepID=A0A0F8U5M9_9EURO|nr:hypothetical protein AOCH_002716 [Aspergillus ochraceoroseus]
MRMGDSDRSAQSLNSFMRPASGANGGAILMRRLPKNMSREALRSMFLFSKDLLDADFVPNDFPEDNGFLSAIARFCTMAGAEEARALLDGKPNSKNDATMIVEIYNPSTPGASFLPRRNTIDHSATRGLLGSVSGNGPLSRQSSRFNGTFQSLEKLTAANPTGSAASDALPSSSESGSRIHNIFSPQSPIGNGVHELPRISGKSMIDQDIDEDTGELLKDPVGAHTARHSLPAANPNDMNPPCNTLYVGNLPPDTSEEELKVLFSKQRGYKRLCFRNKQNGPMCFVEFEDVRTAGKTLNELYGYKLSNSIKTGIRLSFSKNPLGSHLLNSQWATARLGRAPRLNTTTHGIKR